VLKENEQTEVEEKSNENERNSKQTENKCKKHFLYLLSAFIVNVTNKINIKINKKNNACAFACLSLTVFCNSKLFISSIALCSRRESWMRKLKK
jgi:hypothetical protein